MIFSRVEPAITWARVHLTPSISSTRPLPLLPPTLRYCVWYTGNQKGLVCRVGPDLADKACLQCYTEIKVRTKGVRNNNLGFDSIESYNLDAKKQMVNFRTLVYSTIPILLEIY